MRNDVADYLHYATHEVSVHSPTLCNPIIVPTVVHVPFELHKRFRIVNKNINYRFLSSYFRVGHM